MDRLSKSCLNIDTSESANGGKSAVAVSASHIVSSTPVETHVFLNLLHKKPVYIATSDGIVWRINEGKILKTGKVDEE